MPETKSTVMKMIFLIIAQKKLYERLKRKKSPNFGRDSSSNKEPTGSSMKS